jgi:hypothetical protein
LWLPKNVRASVSFWVSPGSSDAVLEYESDMMGVVEKSRRVGVSLGVVRVAGRVSARARVNVRDMLSVSHGEIEGRTVLGVIGMKMGLGRLSSIQSSNASAV